MKIEELMIGDWVKFADEETDDLVGRVLGLDEDGIIIREDTNSVGYPYDPDDVKPIPITHEILEKNGFGYHEDGQYYIHYYLGEPYFVKNMDLHIGTDKEVYWLNYYNNSAYGLHYVHELQHALQLFKAGKEIVLQ